MEEVDFNSLEIEIGEVYLPIGSIVEVEIVRQPLMIYGRKQQQADNEEEVWDYVACPYPQGHIGDNTNVFFNHSQINKVLFKGLETKGEKALKKQLNEIFSDKK